VADPNGALKEGGRAAASSARHAIARALIVAEVALSVILLVGAGLLIDSFARLQDVAPGFNPSRLLTLRVAPPDTKYPTFERGEAFYDELTRRLRAAPGVRSVAATNALPLSGFGGDRTFYIEGRTVTRPEEQSDEQIRFVSAGYFSAMQIPVIAGREFTDRDTLESPRAAVVNQALARKYWPNGDPIGKRVSFSHRAPAWYQIVGTVGTIKHRGLDATGVPELYVPYGQPLFAGWTVRPMFVVVRTAGDPLAMTTTVRQTVAAIDPDLPVSNVRSMEHRMSESLASRRFNMVLLALFALLALILAAVGIYGVVAYAVTERTHEIGVRVALGAQSRDVLTMIVGQGLALAAAGAVLGVCAALGLTRLMAGLLFGVTPADTLTFTGVTLLLLAVAFAASWLPARRAMRVDPLTALLTE